MILNLLRWTSLLGSQGDLHRFFNDTHLELPQLPMLRTNTLS